MGRNLFRRTTGASSADDGSRPVYLAGELLARLLGGFKVGSLETSTELTLPLPGHAHNDCPSKRAAAKRTPHTFRRLPRAFLARPNFASFLCTSI